MKNKISIEDIDNTFYEMYSPCYVLSLFQQRGIGWNRPVLQMRFKLPAIKEEQWK